MQRQLSSHIAQNNNIILISPAQWPGDWQPRLIYFITRALVIISMDSTNSHEFRTRVTCARFVYLCFSYIFGSPIYSAPYFMHNTMNNKFNFTGFHLNFWVCGVVFPVHLLFQNNKPSVCNSYFCGGPIKYITIANAMW